MIMMFFVYLRTVVAMAIPTVKNVHHLDSPVKLKPPLYVPPRARAMVTNVIKAANNAPAQAATMPNPAADPLLSWTAP